MYNGLNVLVNLPKIFSVDVASLVTGVLLSETVDYIWDTVHTQPHLDYSRSIYQ